MSPSAHANGCGQKKKKETTHLIHCQFADAVLGRVHNMLSRGPSSREAPWRWSSWAGAGWAARPPAAPLGIDNELVTRFQLPNRSL